MNSLLFKSSLMKLRIEQPKMFERVFLVPVDPDDFEIDYEATNNTTTNPLGAALFNSNKFQDCLLTTEDEEGNLVYKIDARKRSEDAYEFSNIATRIILRNKTFKVEDFEEIEDRARNILDNINQGGIR
jgi:hypothetical protein